MDESQIEADYKKELEANGVELPVDDSVESEKAEEAPPEAPKAEEKAEEAEKTPESEPREPRKRSIYDDLKEKKADLRSEREAREQAERERDELKQKLDEFSRTNSPEHKSDVPTDVLEYAEQAGADPELVRRILEARPAPVVDPSIAKGIEEFQQWKQQNAQILEKQLFEEEFTRTVPALQSMFPSANAEEINAMKSELDKFAHTPGMHDKDLDYVAFKHKEQLGALVSPRVRGMESKGRNQVDDSPTDWNPGADLTQMSAKQLEAWEAEYKKAVESSKSLVKSPGGKTIL